MGWVFNNIPENVSEALINIMKILKENDMEVRTFDGDSGFTFWFGKDIPRNEFWINSLLLGDEELIKNIKYKIWKEERTEEKISVAKERIKDLEKMIEEENNRIIELKG